MKKWLYNITFLSLLIILSTVTTTKHAEAKNIDGNEIYLFYGTGCPHCADVHDYLEKNDYFKKYSIEYLEVYNNRENALLLEDVFYKYQVPKEYRGVPFILFPKTEKYYVGDSPIIDNFEYQAEKHVALKNLNIEDPEKPSGDSRNEKKDLTIVPVLTGALVDSVNPCAFAVLLLLLSSILSGNLDNKKRALKAGLLFATSIFLSYLAMGLGLYKALSLGNFPEYFMKIIGTLAIVLGMFNLKDYANYGGGGFIMEVPQSWRPKMKSILARITSPAGAFFVGFIISLFLLPCTSGPYIIVLGMLSQKHLFAKALSYLIVYNLVFIIPMILITIAVYKGLDVEKAKVEREKRIRLLHLVAGILLILMGMLVLLGIV